MSDAREIMIVRHAETLANVESRYIGRGDSPISERGMRQLTWLKDRVSAFAPEVAYISPMGRTQATADAVIGAVLRIDMPELVEIGFGEAEGLTFAEIRERGIHLDYTGAGAIAPGGESGASFDARVAAAIAAIHAGPTRAVVVTHGGVARRMLTHMLAIPVDCGWVFALPNAAIAVVRISDGFGRLTHLDAPAEQGHDPS